MIWAVVMKTCSNWRSYDDKLTLNSALWAFPVLFIICWDFQLQRRFDSRGRLQFPVSQSAPSETTFPPENVPKKMSSWTSSCWQIIKLDMVCAIQHKSPRKDEVFLNFWVLLPEFCLRTKLRPVLVLVRPQRCWQTSSAEPRQKRWEADVGHKDLLCPPLHAFSSCFWILQLYKPIKSFFASVLRHTVELLPVWGLLLW